MNCLREAGLVAAAMMIGVACRLAAGRADDAKTKATTKPDTDAAAPGQIWEGKLGVGPGLSLRSSSTSARRPTASSWPGWTAPTRGRKG